MNIVSGALCRNCWAALISFLLVQAAPGANSPPNITPIPDQTILQGETTAALPFMIADAETTAANLTLSSSSSNLTLVPNANIALGGSAMNRTVQISPDPSTNGTTLITVTVRDEANASRSTIFRVTVVPLVPVITIQPQGRSVVIGGSLGLSVSAWGQGPLRYQWRRDSNNILEATNSSLTISNAQPFHAGRYTVLVSNNNGSTESDPAVVTVALLTTGSVWKYNDTGADLGRAWRALDYDDSTWASGPAQLGYGENDENTVVSYGSDPNNRHLTTYFRQNFVVNGAMLHTNLSARLLVDDGAAVYLNGVEVLRNNLPAGEITFGSLAPNAVSGANESAFSTNVIDPGYLRDGLNVLAVEVHQDSGQSDDLSFDLDLVGGANDLPVLRRQPVSQTVAENTPNVTFTVEATGTGPFAYQWQLNGMNIPGATAPSYTIPVATPEQGGSYRVIVIGAYAAVASELALLTVTVPLVNGTDTFAGASLLFGQSGVLRGTSAQATKEAGEPNHGGKRGGKSVWYKWQSPGTGIATFSTVGSSFDTLLGIYQGADLPALTLVAQDEDSGGFYGSVARFNAEANAVYWIAIDGVGFGGSGGPYLLRWNLEITSQTIPAIAVQPQSQGVVAGSNAVFSVVLANNPPGLTYQWYVDGQLIPGATGSSLVLNNVQPAQVGLYTVRVSSNQNRAVDSQPAALEVGSVPGVNLLDKLEDFFAAGTGAGDGLLAASSSELFTAAAVAAPTASGSIALNLGDRYYKFAPGANNSISDPLPCASYFNGTLWLVVTNLDYSVLEFDTEGSFGRDGREVFTRLAVYDAVAGFEIRGDRYQLGCDQPGTAAGRQSRIFVSALPGRVYAVVTAPEDCDRGGPCDPPTLAINVHVWPKFYFFRSGTRETISAVPRAWTPPPTYQWRRNHEAIPAPSAPSLVFESLNCNDAGTYELMVSNGDRTEVIPVAMVFVDENSHLYEEMVPRGHQSDLRVMVFGAAPFRLQRTGSLPSGWEEAGVNLRPEIPLVLVERNLGLIPRRFYKALGSSTILPRTPPCAAPIFPR